MTWTTAQTFRLIELYQSKEVLYRVKDPLYHNKSARRTAQDEIVAGIDEMRPGTTVKEITTKINNLRTQFTKELRELKNRASGSGADETQPKMWCFKQLVFLQDHIHSRKGICNVVPPVNAPTPDQSPVQSTQNDQERQSEYEDVNHQGHEDAFDDSYLGDYMEPLSEIITLQDDAIEVEIATRPTTGQIMESRQTKHTAAEPTTAVRPTAAAAGSSKAAPNLHKTKFRSKKRAAEDADGSRTTFQAIGDTLNKLLVNEEPENVQDTFGQFITGELQQFKDEKLMKKCKRELVRLLVHFQELDDE